MSIASNTQPTMIQFRRAFRKAHDAIIKARAFARTASNEAVNRRIDYAGIDEEAWGKATDDFLEAKQVVIAADNFINTFDLPVRTRDYE